MNKKVITNFTTQDDFFHLLKNNPGIFIIKFGAKWCEPCKKIKTVVDAVFSTTPEDVICADIDISEGGGNKDIYEFFKRRRMINGIPTLFMYKRGNDEPFPDETVTGVNAQSLHTFFLKCGQHLSSVKTTVNSINA